MAEFRNTFFSFHYDDADLASQIRECNRFTKDRFDFRDWAPWETVRLRSWSAIKAWIDDQLVGTSVTVVLIGQETALRGAVRYEIEASVLRGNGIIGVYLNQMQGLKTRNRGVRPLPLSPFSTIPPRDFLQRTRQQSGRNKLAGLLAKAPPPTNALRDAMNHGSLSKSPGLGLLGHVDPTPRSSATGLLASAMEPTPRLFPTGLLASAMKPTPDWLTIETPPVMSRQEMMSRMIAKRPGSLADEIDCYCWKIDGGYNNIADWIEKAAKDAGK